MNLSGCSKREVGIFWRTLSPENRPTPFESRPTLFESRPTQVLKNPDKQICNVIMSKILAKQYSKNSNIYK